MRIQSKRRAFRAGPFLVLAVVGFALPVTAVKKLDEDNRFCVSCHLHGSHLDNMFATPVVTLAGAHAVAQTSRPAAGHPERCFTCHSGEGVTGWTQVTLLSAWDAARWVAGVHHEPKSMRLPVADRACLKCHAKDVRGSQTAEETQDFHQLTDHRGLTVACVSCHQVHRRGEASRKWLHNDVVRAQCARCHREMATGFKPLKADSRHAAPGPSHG
jgi:nitrate/TMAO reductase-like tetraheme cytochrome c subunit